MQILRIPAVARRAKGHLAERLARQWGVLGLAVAMLSVVIGRGAVTDIAPIGGLTATGNAGVITSIEGLAVNDLILGTTTFFAVLIIGFNLLSDILTVWLNPRLRAGSGRTS